MSIIDHEKPIWSEEPVWSTELSKLLKLIHDIES